MTSPRSHSQEGSGAHSPSVPLQSQCALTWPPASRVHTPLHSRWQNPAPGGQGPGSSSLPGWPRADRHFRLSCPCGLRGLPRSTSFPHPVRPPLRPGSPRELEEAALRTLPRADLPAARGGGSTCTHFIDGCTKPARCSHPPPTDFKTFRPLRTAEANDFQVQGAHQRGVPGCWLPRSRRLSWGSPGPAPSRVRSPQARGSPANSESA